jgi:hypothetical protein
MTIFQPLRTKPEARRNRFYCRLQVNDRANVLACLSQGNADVAGRIRGEFRSVEDSDLLSAFAVPLNPAERFHHGASIVVE